MRARVVSHYLGMLVVVLGVFMLIPLAWSLFRGEDAAPAFAISAAISLGAGGLAWRLISSGERSLLRREAILVVVGGWLVVSLFGTLPYVFTGTFTNFLDAYFEGLSGFTTTGATVLTNIAAQEQSILLWRSITQWLGGMGIITLFVALFPILGIGATQLVEAEMPGPQAERLTPRIRDTAKAVWLLYLGFSGLELVMLLIARLPLFDALTVTFSTMPTGGFTATSLSIQSYNSPFVEGIVIFFMIIAGVNFGLFYFLLWKRQVRQVLKSAEFRVYLGLLAGMTILIALDLWRNMDMSVGEAARLGGFQVVSIMTTTGFATADFNLWPSFARTALLLLMAIGASAGSTGGALKVIRLIVLVKYGYHQIVHAFNPRAVLPLKLGGNALPAPVVSRIVGMSVLYFLTLLGGFLLMSAIIGPEVERSLGPDATPQTVRAVTLETSLSSVVSAVGNVGPGLGLVGPTENYMFVPPLGKGVLMVFMVVGRLELLTIMMLFLPVFWRWR